MAVFKKILCAKCNKTLGRTAKESDKSWQRKVCPCGGSATLSPNWFAEVYLPGSDGKLHKATRVGGPKKTDGEAKERELLNQRDDGAQYEKKLDYSLRGFYASWMEWLQIREQQGKLSIESAKSYRMRTDVHVMNAFGGMDMRNITYDDVDRYVAARFAENVKPATINREVATLKRMLSIAVQKKIIRVNTLLGYEMLDEDNELDRHLSPDEITRLYAACSDDKATKHLLPIVVLMLNTGLRINGVLTLRWEEIDWKRNEIQKVVKGKTLVRIPMTDELRYTLSQWRIRDGVHRAAGWVFPSPKKHDSHMLITSNFGLQSALKRANIKGVTNHTMRHTFATIFLEQFPDHIETLRVILGQTSAYITRRYAHITEKSKKQTMGAFRVTG